MAASSPANCPAVKDSGTNGSTPFTKVGHAWDTIDGATSPSKCDSSQDVLRVLKMSRASSVSVGLHQYSDLLEDFVQMQHENEKIVTENEKIVAENDQLRAKIETLLIEQTRTHDAYRAVGNLLMQYLRQAWPEVTQ